MTVLLPTDQDCEAVYLTYLYINLTPGLGQQGLQTLHVSPVGRPVKWGGARLVQAIHRYLQMNIQIRG